MTPPCARSKNVRPRTPLGRAADMDYDVLSDEEWEEEPEGEELGGGDGDDDDDERGSDDEDDGFMVEGALRRPRRCSLPSREGSRGTTG